MKVSFFLTTISAASAANFFILRIYAPSHPQLDSQPINAFERSFVIGASTPSTRCALKDPRQCPPGTATLVNEDLTLLAAAVPGGQRIYVLADGSISYSVAHSAARPPGSQAGDFYAAKVDGKDPTIISWRSKAGHQGIWVCPTSPTVPVTSMAVLKASTLNFTGQGCLSVSGLRREPAGSAFGAWEYT